MQCCYGLSLLLALVVESKSVFFANHTSNPFCHAILISSTQATVLILIFVVSLFIVSILV